MDPIVRVLGVVTPTQEWQRFPVISLGSEVFIVNFAGNFNRFQGWLLVRALYTTGEVAIVKRVWVGTELRELFLPIPELRKQAGDSPRWFEVCRRQRWQRNPLGVSPITVTLLEIIGFELPAPGLADGSTLGDLADLGDE